MSKPSEFEAVWYAYKHKEPEALVALLRSRKLDYVAEFIEWQYRPKKRGRQVRPDFDSSHNEFLKSINDMITRIRERNPEMANMKVNDLCVEVAKAFGIDPEQLIRARKGRQSRPKNKI